MLCCAGLYGGLYVGQQLGGPWMYIAPAAGFGLGLMGDMKFMHKMHKPSAKETDEDKIPDPRSFQKSNNELPNSPGVVSKALLASEDTYPGPP